MSIVISTKPQGQKTKKGKKNKKQANQQQQKKVTIQVAQPRQQKKAGPRRSRGPTMSECGSKYFAAVSMPFSNAALGACLPFAPDKNSLKANSYMRLPIITNSSGDFVVFLSPCIANDLVSVWHTTGTFTGIPMVVATLNTPPANWVSHNNTTLPFTSSTLNAGGVEGRIVSMGIRVTYTGTVSAMSGYYQIYSSPDHGNVNNSNLYTYLNTSSEVKVRRVMDKPVEQGFTIINADERSYVSLKDRATTLANQCVTFYPWSGNIDINGRQGQDAGYISNGSTPIVIRGIGLPPSTNCVLVEIIGHYEYVGPSATFGLSPSHNDQEAGEKILAAADRAPPEYNARPDSTWAATVRKTFNDVMREASGHATRGAMSAGMNLGRLYVQRLGRRSGQLRLN